MNPDSKARVTQLFADVLDLPEGQRDAFLDDVCGDNSELRREIESLLGARKGAKGFFERKEGEAHDLMAPSVSSSGEMPSVVDHYEIHQEIGAGGMGEVYAATDRALGERSRSRYSPATSTPGLSHGHGDLRLSP